MEKRGDRKWKEKDTGQEKEKERRKKKEEPTNKNTICLSSFTCFLVSVNLLNRSSLQFTLI